MMLPLWKQLSDCYRGIVIDGLNSLYTQSAASTVQVLLKALNNRKHIYVVNLSDSYAALKERERAQRETEGKTAPVLKTYTSVSENWPNLNFTSLTQLSLRWFIESKTVCWCPSETLQREKSVKEEQWLQELDEEEYEALPEKEKERIDQQQREKLKQPKLR